MNGAKRVMRVWSEVREAIGTGSVLGGATLLLLVAGSGSPANAQVIGQPGLPELPEVPTPPVKIPGDPIVPKEPPPVSSPVVQGSRTWVIPNVVVSPYDPDRPFLRPVGLEYGLVNPGWEPVTVGVVAIDSNGRLSLDLSGSAEVPAGGSMAGSLRDPGSWWQGWVLIDASAPVLPSAALLRRNALSDRDMAYSIPVYPIDCARPVGFEFACQFSSAVSGAERSQVPLERIVPP